jgi:hypothetical protein
MLRPDSRAASGLSNGESQATAADYSALQPGMGNPQLPVNGNVNPITTDDMNVILSQLQVMQNTLQAASVQLALKDQANPFPTSSSTPRTMLPGEDIPVILAEIERLNQIMQPLMVQLEAATSNSSSRSLSELAALRTQVNTIHQRLAYLLSRVAAASPDAVTPHNPTAGSWDAQQAFSHGNAAGAYNPDRAEYEKLYQTMIELQSTLRQMQVQVTNP